MSKVSDLFSKIRDVFKDYTQVEDTDLYIADGQDPVVGAEVVQLHGDSYIKPIDGEHGKFTVQNYIITSIVEPAPEPTPEPIPEVPAWCFTEEQYNDLVSRLSKIEEHFNTPAPDPAPDPAPEDPIIDNSRMARIMRAAERYKLNS